MRDRDRFEGYRFDGLVLKEKVFVASMCQERVRSCAVEGSATMQKRGRLYHPYTVNKPPKRDTREDTVEGPLNIREKIVGWSNEQGKGGGRSGKK